MAEAGAAAVTCVLDARAAVGESPVWSVGERKLYWVDVAAPALHRFDPSTGRDECWPMPAAIGCCALGPSGTVVVALANGLHRFDPATAALALIVDPEPDLPGNRLNDGRCDRAGRFWIGSMRDPAIGEPRGSLYSVGPGAAVRRHLSGLSIPNGLAFSPAADVLYVSDSHPATRSIWACDFDLADGVIGQRRLFVDTAAMPGRPDGAAVDAEGCYWSAANDGWELVRYTPSGAVDRRVALPVAKPSMVAFGGERLATLFVTSIRPPGSERDQPLAGGLFAFHPGVSGLAEPVCRVTVP